jgi:hypothetical protein
VDEEKRAETSWDEVERLGPYQLHEQVHQAEPDQGELYRATDETSGATALVFKPTAEKEAEPLTDWRVRVISSASPGYLALEVVESPWSEAPATQSAESLVFAFEALRDGVRRMARHLPDSAKPRSGWRLGWGLAGAAVVCALLCALIRLAPLPQPASAPESLASAVSAPTRHDVPTAVAEPHPFTSGWLVDAPPQGELVLAGPLPSEPFKGQKRPPCKRYVQVELVGGCWMPHKLKAPCPDELYEHQGECYAPVFAAQPPPQALGR